MILSTNWACSQKMFSENAQRYEVSLVGRLSNFILDPDDLLRLEQDELGRFILKALLVPREALEGSPSLVRFLNSLYPIRNEQYPRNYKERIKSAISDAWYWLEREGYLVPKPDNGENGYREISKAGEAFAEERNTGAFSAAKVLPRDLVHVAIRDRVYAQFSRGEYDAAIFSAFKEVEVRVRSAGGYGDEVLGRDLMRKAFELKSGPLTDASAERSEQQALSDLFAGSIGYYKNPQSHRNVDIPLPQEAAEIIMLASHLLRIVEARAQRTAK